MLLADALDVRAGDVIALTGGGGKTSALYLLGRELAQRGWPVVLTGTTRFTPPSHGPAPNLHILALVRAPEQLLQHGPWPLTLTAGLGSKGRFLPLDPELVCALAARRREAVVVAEADGSALRPFKAPAAHEPVIPACATLVASVCGLDVLDRPLDERSVHRPELVGALTGTPPGTPVDEALVAAVLLHPAGGRKGLPPGARWVPILNKADTPERHTRAQRIAAVLLTATDRVVISRLLGDTPSVSLVRRDRPSPAQ